MSIFILVLLQNFRITPYINYAYIHCLKKTKDRTILRLLFWKFLLFFSKSFLKRAKFGAFCTKIRTFWNKFRTIFAFQNLTFIMTPKIVIINVISSVE